MTTPLPTFAIETVGLTKRYGPKEAVSDLTLRIPRGSAFGFIGPNGAGKSTTIKMLMGMARPSAGEARVLGFDAVHDSVAVKQRVGYVPELHFIYRWMRVGEVIAFCRPLYENWNDRFCADLLKLFELDPERKVKQLSKGMVAKLALLLAVAHEPEVLILDEPTSGLDPVVREEFLDGVLRTLCERERTILFSSHALSDVQRIAETIGLIYEGRLIDHCRTEDLLNGTKRIRAVLRDGCAPGPPPEGTIWQRVQQREWLMTVRGYSPATLEYLRTKYSLDNVEVIDLGLEDVFKDLIKGRKATA
jgi:ABC-2 type transport system ATP-binding protein